MIVGIGVDTVEHARFTRAIARAPGLLRRIFTDDELELPTHSLAARFAAREAAIKALGGYHGMAMRDFPIARKPKGRPVFDLDAHTWQRLLELGISRLHVSLTHDGGLSTAFVIAEGDLSAGADGTRPAPTPPY